MAYTFFDANCPMMVGRVVEYVTELVLVLNHKIWQHTVGDYTLNGKMKNEN